MHFAHILKHARATGLVLALFAASTAHAASFATRPIRLVVPFAPGGATDIVARSISEQLGKELGQVVIVENRAGAGGAIGADYVSKSPADGYTIGLATVSTMAANPAINPQNPYDPVKGFTPIISLATVPVVMTVNPRKITATNLKELVEILKKNPGKYSFASAGTGGVGHLDGELFKVLTGTDVLHIPYKGAGPALTDLLGGQVDMMFDNLPSTLPHIRSGKLKAIAIMSNQRIESLPDVQTFAEAGWKEANNIAWMGIVAPPGLPADIQEQLRLATVRALSDPGVQKRFADSGIYPDGGSSAQFATRIQNELALRRQIVVKQKLKLD